MTMRMCSVAVTRGSNSGDSKRGLRTRRRNRMVAAAGMVGLLATQSAPALTIVPTYSAAVQSNPNFASIQTAFNFAAAQYQNAYSDPITINIAVASNTSGLGQSNTNLQLLAATNATSTYALMRTTLLADSKTANDIAAYSTLGATDPTGGGAFVVTFAQAKALGLRAATDPANDGTFTFNSTLSYTFDPNNRAVAGSFDFIGTSEHEISEIMGRIGILGQNLSGASNYGPLDLFGFKGAGVRSLNQTDTGVYFSIDNGTTSLRAFNPPGNGGDLRDWASGQGTDAYNAFANTGEKDDISAVDQKEMDVIGYDLVPEPATAGLLGLGALGMLARRRRRA